MRAIVVGALALAGCHPVAPRAPAPVVALISANAEWTIVRERYAAIPVQAGPYAWFVAELPGGAATFVHGGWGKVAAAASTQYVIDHFHPALVVNLGTCGGFEGHAQAGDVILARQTIIYDIVELMGDSREAIADYATALEPARWPDRAHVRVETLVSADRDLAIDQIAGLAARYGAVAGDWESGAIAWVAAYNHTPVVILRGVSDVVTAQGDVTYGDPGAFQRATRATMNDLLDRFAAARAKL